LNILIVDDHPVVCSGIRAALVVEKDLNIIGEADDAEATIHILSRVHVDFIIMDVRLKNNDDGIELLKAIKKRYPDIYILVFTTSDAAVCAERAFESGADGFFCKEEPIGNILVAVKDILSKGVYMSEESLVRIGMKHIAKFKTGFGISDVLTNREMEIFRLLGMGFKRGEIAEKLSLNVNTIESHRRKIREKLNLSDSGELTKLAVKYTREKVYV